MNNRKGQFMVISAVIISLLIMATSVAIGNSKNTGFSPNHEAHYSNMIRDAAINVEEDNNRDIRSFNRMISDIEAYSSRSIYWDRSSKTDCFNVTLRSANSEIEMSCVPVDS